MEMPSVQSPPTDYSKFVIKVIPRMTRLRQFTSDTDSSSVTTTSPASTLATSTVDTPTTPAKPIDQQLLRHCIGLSSSYLVADTTLDPERGVNTWFTGFNQLVEIVCALHARGELELETMNAASRACSECWSVGGCWKGLEEAREGVRDIAAKLKRLLDENGKTYKGERIYAP